jgi:hypothetical protein
MGVVDTRVAKGCRERYKKNDIDYGGCLCIWANSLSPSPSPLPFRPSLSHKPTQASTHGVPYHRRARGRSQLGRRPPQRGVGPRRRAQRRFGGAVADEGVQGGASGGAGVSAHPAGARGVRRAYFGWESERRVEAESGDAAVGADACSRDRSLWPRVLRGEGRPRRPRWINRRANAFFFRGGRGVRGSPAVVMRRVPRCSRSRGGRERQRRGASVPARRRR